MKTFIQRFFRSRSGQRGAGKVEYIISARLQAEGQVLLARESFRTADSDFKPQLVRIQRKNPDVLFILGVGPTQGVAFNQARQLGIKSQVVGYQLCGQRAMLVHAVRSLEGALSIEMSADLQTDRWRRFSREYERRTGRREVDFIAAIGHEYVQIVTAALQSGARTASQIRAFLAEAPPIAGVLSPIVFDAQAPQYLGYQAHY